MANNNSIHDGGVIAIIGSLIIIGAVCIILTWDYAFGDQLLFQTPDGPMWYNPVLERWEEVTTHYNTNPMNVSNTSTVLK